MIYQLYDDGTYKKLKSSNKLVYTNTMCTLIDISTDRKGPLFTAVIEPKINKSLKNFNITMDISYAPYDVPFDDALSLSSTFEIDNLQKYYNIYPLINQLFGFNVFKDSHCLESCINVDTIDIICGNYNVHLDESASDKNIRKTFKYMNMLTNVNEFGDEVIVLTKKKWEIVNFDDLEELSFKKVFIPLEGLESLYCMSYEEYLLFSDILSLEVTISSYNEVDDTWWNKTFRLTHLKDILSSCIFIPQLILLETEIYREPKKLSIEIETARRILELKVTEKEILQPKNTCIFNLISNLLKLQL